MTFAKLRSCQIIPMQNVILTKFLKNVAKGGMVIPITEGR